MVTMNRTTRNTTWLLSTLTAVVLLFGYKTSTGGSSLTAESAVVTSGTAPVSGTGGGTSGGTAHSGGSGSGSSGSSGSSSDSSGSSGTGGSGSGGTGGSGKASRATSVTGAVAQTQWGPVQVQLSVSGGKVTDVQVLAYPSGNPRDAEINSYALPILVKETLSAQSANIDMVSGATVTSQGYLASLQSALDQAGV